MDKFIKSEDLTEIDIKEEPFDYYEEYIMEKKYLSFDLLECEVQSVIAKEVEMEDDHIKNREVDCDKETNNNTKRNFQLNEEILFHQVEVPEFPKDIIPKLIFGKKENEFVDFQTGFSYGRERIGETFVSSSSCSSNTSLRFRSSKQRHENNGTEIANSQEKRFKCSLCKFQAKYQSNFARHLLTHSNIKMFKCSECDYSCNQKSNLKTHLLSHSKKHTKFFKCFDCRYKCKHRRNLKTHLLTHSLTHSKKTHLLTHSNIKMFKCCECDYESKWKGNLKAHLLTHSKKTHLLTHPNVKIFKCCECDYESKWKTNLKSHLVTHSNAKMFKCCECDYESKWKGNLKTHSLTHSDKI